MFINEYASLKDGVMHIRFYRTLAGRIVGRATFELIPWTTICLQ